VRRIVAALLLAGLCLPGAAETWYVSNRLGMKLEVIPRFRADDFAYVARETVEGTATTLTLYKTEQGGARPLGVEVGASPFEGPPAASEEVSRWERSAQAGGLVEEREYERVELGRVGTYRADGRLLRETLYAGGLATEELDYRYAAGLLRSVQSRKPAGEVIWTTTYRVTPSGLLRATERTGEDPEAAAFSFSGRKLQEEDLESPQHTVVLRYDGSGKRIVWEVYAGPSLLRAIYSEYDPATGALASEEDRDRAERTERSYDTAGNVRTESVYRADKLVATLDYTYDEAGRKATSQRRTEAGIELQTFGYAAGGSLAWVEYRERGTLRSRAVYTGENSRYEEVIQSERLSLRVYYEGDQKLREEVVRDGKVLRTRVLSEGR
jgi:hypothetical protein